MILSELSVFSGVFMLIRMDRRGGRLHFRGPTAVSAAIQYCDVMLNYYRSALLLRHNTAPPASVHYLPKLSLQEGGLGSLVTLRRYNWWQMLRSVNGQRSICVVESSVEGISETDFMFSCFVYRFPNAINICATSLTMRHTGLNKGACVQSDTECRTQTATNK